MGGNWILALLKREQTSGRQMLKIGVCQESSETTYQLYSLSPEPVSLTVLVFQLPQKFSGNNLVQA